MNKTIFLDMFGYSYEMILWDYLLTTRELSFAFSDVIHATEPDKEHLLEEVFIRFEKEMIINPTTTPIAGEGMHYKLNTNNELVKKMIEIFDLIIGKTEQE